MNPNLVIQYLNKPAGTIKYGHSGVGKFSRDGMVYEQNEIEFLPANVEDAADQLVIAKWIIRTLAARNISVYFSYLWEIKFPVSK